MTGLSERGRAIASIALGAVAAIFLFVGTIAFYAREEVIDQNAFADRAVAALDDDGVRNLVGREIVTGLIDRGSSDLVAAVPQLPPPPSPWGARTRAKGATRSATSPRCTTLPA